MSGGSSSGSGVNGFGRDTLPTSLQLLGRAFSEGTLLELAHRYQQATDWHRRRPTVEPAAAASERGATPAPWTAQAEPGRSDLYRL